MKRIWRKALTLAGEEMRPRYLAEDLRLPSVWMGDRALLIVNWENVPRHITLPGLARSVCSDKPYLQENGSLTVTLYRTKALRRIIATEQKIQLTEPSFYDILKCNDRNQKHEIYRRTSP